MKQTWKTFSITTKRQAIRDVKAFMAKGHSLSKSRALVARPLDVTANTIYNWERKLTGKSIPAVNVKRNLVSPVDPSTLINNGNIRHNTTVVTGVNLRTPHGEITLSTDLIENIARLAGTTH